ncbi:hypothetical protein [Actinacidiphila oryziradicis]|uniref:Uncharacterized protein n=1 Tax=Actinacidiphila oryziradicis TaxID=2571141 RepID=A0A4U0SRC0_9ACTN|nr:hypothetical protein [Actinacidiphila oryziradicis]TKA11958.1 hypothetical protein FCI23_09100 [Actinacidiphila oryziradicis]
MAYVIVLDAVALDEMDDELSLELSFTKTVPDALRPPTPSPEITLMFARLGGTRGEYVLRWLGVVRDAWGDKVATRDRRIKIEPLRQCPGPISGTKLLGVLGDQVSTALSGALRVEATILLPEHEKAVLSALRGLHPALPKLLDWLSAVAEPDLLDSSRPEDRSWQEQQDAARAALSIGHIPPSRLAAWRRPARPDAPYLSGIIRDPSEQSLIEYDTQNSVPGARVFSAWSEERLQALGSEFRCDIHVFEHQGRRVEVANVNATTVERRLGTDLIYYHEATQSCVLVQYKRLSPYAGERWIYIDDQLRDQLDRLEAVSELSREPKAPHEWRLGRDPCFLKLAYWPRDDKVAPGPAPGMYLPLSYIRLLLDDDCTLGPMDGRRLGYGYVDRYLVNTQFVELIQHGLAGTVGTSLDQLLTLGEERAQEGYAVAIAVEHATAPVRESVREREKINRQRGKAKKAAGRRRSKPQPPVAPGASSDAEQGVLFVVDDETEAPRSSRRRS